MAAAPDPFEPYLNRAASLFDLGDVVQAGQIWQAILKRDPAHQVARAGLYKVKVYFDARATQDGLDLPLPPQVATPTQQPGIAENTALMERGCALYDAGQTDEAMAIWDRVQAMDPDNALVRGYLEGAKRKLETDAARTGAIPIVTPKAEVEPHPAAPQPVPVPEPEPEPVPEPIPAAPVPAPLSLQTQEENERLLRDGCTLFDMGQVPDALQKWERILASDPNHALALAYANDARKDLGLPPLDGDGDTFYAPVSALPVMPAASLADPEDSQDRVEQLVRDGVQIYDMGMVDEAIERWQQALELNPGHSNAAEYLRMAQRDQQQAAPSPRPVAAAPVPAVPAVAAVVPGPALEPRIQEAERLLAGQRFEEATRAFQRLMEEQPLEPRIQHGYQQARTFLAASAPVRPPVSLEEAPVKPVPAALPAPVGPPRALTNRANPARDGLRLPGPLQNLSLPSWLQSPRNLGLAAGTLVVLSIGLYFLREHQLEVALKTAVTTAKADAMAPVSRQVQVIALTETVESVRKEAESALADDPLLALFRAQEWVRLDPNNAAAVQFQERARNQMAALPPTGNLAEFEKSVQAGDMESAQTTIVGLLRQAPDDTELREKARAVNLALAQYYANKERFSDARDCLSRVRAMFPQDRLGTARLKLLETIQGLTRTDRAGWIQLLG